MNVKKDFGNIFSIGAQYAYIKGSENNIGLSTALRLGPVQLFFSSDNVIPLINPMKGQNVNMRFGMNLLFGKIKTQKDEFSVPTGNDGVRNK